MVELKKLLEKISGWRNRPKQANRGEGFKNTFVNINVKIHIWFIILLILATSYFMVLLTVSIYGTREIHAYVNPISLVSRDFWLVHVHTPCN